MFFVIFVIAFPSPYAMFLCDLLSGAISINFAKLDIIIYTKMACNHSNYVKIKFKMADHFKAKNMANLKWLMSWLEKIGRLNT